MHLLELRWLSLDEVPCVVLLEQPVVDLSKNKNIKKVIQLLFGLFEQTFLSSRIFFILFGSHQNVGVGRRPLHRSTKKNGLKRA